MTTKFKKTEYEGNQTITIVDDKDKFVFSAGARKLQAIMNHIPEIQAWLTEQESKTKTPKATKKVTVKSETEKVESDGTTVTIA